MQYEKQNYITGMILFVKTKKKDPETLYGCVLAQFLRMYVSVLIGEKRARNAYVVILRARTQSF